jgi:hypothetical protein
VEEPTANGAYITKLMTTLHEHPYDLHKSDAQYPRRKGKAAQKNTKQEILKQITFKRMDDDRKENIRMLINFN